MIISIKEKIFSKHGWYQAEQQAGHWFEVLVKVRVSAMAMPDDSAELLSNTFNYEILHSIISTEMDNTKKLIETVAQGIYNRTLLEKQVEAASVSISKLAPSSMPDVESVTIILGDQL